MKNGFLSLNKLLVKIKPIKIQQQEKELNEIALVTRSISFVLIKLPLFVFLARPYQFLLLIFIKFSHYVPVDQSVQIKLSLEMLKVFHLTYWVFIVETFPNIGWKNSFLVINTFFSVVLFRCFR